MMRGKLYMSIIIVLGIMIGAAMGAVNHVHYVDQAKQPNGFTNFLFRGGTPCVTNSGGGMTFDYPSLVLALRNASKLAGVSLPQNFRILDVNLENNDQGDVDFTRTYTEWLFFLENSSLGQFSYWQTQGTQSNATLINSNNSNYLQYLVSTLPVWDSDLLTSRIPKLRSMLNQYYDSNIVIYGHCDCGCDRTGEIFGSYYMAYQGMSWEHVNSLNAQIAGRPMCCSNYLMMQFYCLYLNQDPPRPPLNCLSTQPCDVNC